MIHNLVIEHPTTTHLLTTAGIIDNLVKLCRAREITLSALHTDNTQPTPDGYATLTLPGSYNQDTRQQRRGTFAALHRDHLAANSRKRRHTVLIATDRALATDAVNAGWVAAVCTDADDLADILCRLRIIRRANAHTPDTWPEPVPGQQRRRATRRTTKERP